MATSSTLLLYLYTIKTFSRLLN